MSWLPHKLRTDGVESDTHTHTKKHVRQEEMPQEANWDEALFEEFHSLFRLSKERLDLMSVLLE